MIARGIEAGWPRRLAARCICGRPPTCKDWLGQHARIACAHMSGLFFGSCDHWPRWASRTVRSKHESGISPNIDQQLLKPRKPLGRGNAELCGVTADRTGELGAPTDGTGYALASASVRPVGSGFLISTKFLRSLGRLARLANRLGVRSVGFPALYIGFDILRRDHRHLMPQRSQLPRPIVRCSASLQRD